VPALCCPTGRAEHVLSRANESARSEMVRLAGGRRGQRERQARQEEAPAERQRAYRAGLEQIEAVAQRRLVRRRAAVQRWEEEEEKARQRWEEWQEQQRQEQAAAAAAAAREQVKEVAAVVKALVNQLVTTVQREKTEPKP